MFVELKYDSDSSVRIHILSKDSTNCGEKIFRKQIVPVLALSPLAPIPLALSPLAPIPSSIADHLPGQPPLPLCPISSSLHRSSLQTLLSLLIHPPIPAVSLASEAGRLAVGPHSPSCPSPIPQIFYRKLPTAASSHSRSPFQGILVENPAFLPLVDPPQCPLIVHPHFYPSAPNLQIHFTWNPRKHTNQDPRRTSYQTATTLIRTGEGNRN